MTEPIIIYKTIYKSYTPALKRAQDKYRKTEKGRRSRARCRRNYYAKVKDKLKIPVECPHCKKKYSGLYIKRHIKASHVGVRA